MQNSSFYYDASFPWYETNDDKNFKKILRRSIIAFCILGIIIPFLPVPEAEKKQLNQVSPRLAKLIVKKKQEKKKPKIIKKEPKKEIRKKTEKKTAKKEAKKPVKKKIEQSGLLALSDDLADLRESFDLGKIDKTQTVNKQVKKYNASKLISSSAKKLSGGVDKSRLTSATVEQKLDSHATSSVSSNITVAKTRYNRQTGKARRTREEIEAVFQKYKGSFYSMYNRSLRRDPTIQGRVTIELTISPSGQVTACKILSSELGNKSLESKIIARVKLMRFAAKDVDTEVVTYPIDFFPS
ncbi:MAG: AgmX/PglI C-terminal domain-containing protein [Thioalkalispiraceae bacterium]|jgi:TonB family protein